MADIIDIKDEKYLQDYEKQIRKLPLNELYEVLAIIKKDSSPERINIVLNRIQEMESERQSSKKRQDLSRETTENSPRAKSEKRVTVEDLKKRALKGKLHNSDPAFKQLTEEEMDEVRQFVSDLAQKAKKDKPQKEEHHHHHHRHHHKLTPVEAVTKWCGTIVLFGLFIYSMFLHGGKPNDNIQQYTIVYALEIIPFVGYGLGYLIARSYHRAKKNAPHLGIAIFLILKASLGYFMQLYPGAFYMLSEEGATKVSAIVFPITLVFAINLFLKKRKVPHVSNGLIPLAVALIAEISVIPM